MLLAAFSCAFLGTYLAVPPVVRLARRLGIVDHPAHRKRHERAVAYLGGVAVLGVAIPVSLAFARLLTAPAAGKVAFLVAGAAAAGALGLVDDWRPLRGRHKLVGQLLIIIPWVVFGFRFEVLDIPTLDPIDLGYWSIPLTVLWMVTACNAVNVIDGVDGLATSVIAPVVGTAALCALVLHDRVTLLVCVAALGSLLAFLRFNWSPARIYLGDCGSLGLGFLAAGLLLAVGQEPSTFDGVLPPPTRYPFEYRPQLATLAFLYPVFEILLSVVRRTLQGKAIGSADNDHIHHCLQRSGWRSTQICAAAATISILAGGAVAAAVRGLDALSALAIMAASLSIGVVLHVCGYPEQFFPSRVRLARSSFLMCRHFTAMQLLKLEVAGGLEEAFALLRQACEELGVARLELRVRDGDERQGRRSWSADGGDETQETPEETLALPDGSAEATWQFLAAEYPHDLEVEYRVRIHELVARFLERVRNAEAAERSDFVESSGDGAQAPSPAVSCQVIAARRAEDSGGGRSRSARPPLLPRHTPD